MALPIVNFDDFRNDDEFLRNFFRAISRLINWTFESTFDSGLTQNLLGNGLPVTRRVDLKLTFDVWTHVFEILTIQNQY